MEDLHVEDEVEGLCNILIKRNIWLERIRKQTWSHKRKFRKEMSTLVFYAMTFLINREPLVITYIIMQLEVMMHRRNLTQYYLTRMMIMK